ncbi:MAG: diaminopimelate decarboxylase [Longimicrobiales bacterium]|nr:diaminopimelate decarboxylase [Longimicrobiales bacterium]
MLHAGDRSVEEIVAEHGTPLYLYDARVVDDRVRAFQEAFGDLDFLLAYSVKANGTLALLDRIARLGAGADIVSGGELFRALEAGVPPERIVFAGVGKRQEEMEAALEAGIHAFHVESEGELHLLADVAGERGEVAPISIRINPDVAAPSSHDYIRTGHAAAKFGVPIPRALELYRWASERKALRIRGVDLHIGSQVNAVEPYRAALGRVLEVVDALEADGIDVEYVDLGGGFAVPEQKDAEKLEPADVAEVLLPELRTRGLRLVLEPGRAIVAEAGLLVARVLYVKEQGGVTFVVTDAGMTDFLRPSHYNGYHRIEGVREGRDRSIRTVDVVGPICESGDFLGRDRRIPLPEPGDLLAVRDAGAYGFVMSMQYNGRPRPAEVLVDGSHVHLIRTREDVRDLIRGESIP